MNGRELKVMETQGLEATNRAEIDVQIRTAHEFPRDVKKALAKATELSTLSQETAAECFYSLPRAGKTLMGPSVRLAEIIASTWGNLRVAVRVQDIGEREVTVCGICHDLESNVAIACEVKRRITTKDGKRFNDDMILTTANAASAVAFRNSVFKVVPKAVWHGVYDKALAASKQTQRPIAERRKLALGYFATLGVDTAKVLKTLGRAKVEDITADDLQTLTGYRNAIQEETSTAAEIFNGSAQTDDSAPAWDAGVDEAGSDDGGMPEPVVVDDGTPTQHIAEKTPANPKIDTPDKVSVISTEQAEAWAEWLPLRAKMGPEDLAEARKRAGLTKRESPAMGLEALSKLNTSAEAVLAEADAKKGAA
jgi:hypothetical protein